MENLAELLFEAHHNPIVKVNISGNKIYLPKDIKEESSVRENIGILKNTISFPRVERRSARSLAIWLEEEHLAKVVKKYCQHFGFQNKAGTYLYPEEALFLLETNRLEILWKDIPITIQQGYSLIINNDILPLDEYRIYKKLALQGFKVLIIGNQISNTDEPENKKIKLANEKYTVSSISNEFEESSQICEPTEKINKLLKGYKYKICTARKKDFYNVTILENGELNPNIGLANDNVKNLYGIPLLDNVTFYRFEKVDIPNIFKDEVN